MSKPLEETADEAQLARFQAALLELLAEPLTPAEIAARLQMDAAFAPYREYTASFEPRLIEVAAALVQKWGRREAGAAREAGTFPGYTTAHERKSENSPPENS